MNRSCYYHPEHKLHNFCVTPECSLPLCPKCINIHLNQSVNERHHIQSLNETAQMVRQQLDTAIEAIGHSISSIQQGEFTPQNCYNEYLQIVEKYRLQAIEKINQHYEQIKRELFQQLKSKYTCHFGSIAKPMEETMMELKRSRKLLEQKPIECMIKVISQEMISHVEKLLETIDDKKQAFKYELPRLQGIDGNMLKIVPGGLDRILSKTFKQSQRLHDKTMMASFQSSERYLGQLDDMQRINRLEAELQSLRGQCY